VQTNQGAKKKSKSKQRQVDDEEEESKVELDPMQEYLALSRVELRDEIESL